MTQQADASPLELWLPESAAFCALPDGPFDPVGNWRLSYVLLQNHPALESRRIRARGLLRVARAADADGTATLDVQRDLRTQQGHTFRRTWQVRCRTDLLGTPVEWRSTAVLLDGDGRPVEPTQQQDEGRMLDGRIEMTSRPSRPLRVDGPVTGNWTLFEALPRLRGGDIEPATFDLLEDFEVLKRHHRLGRWGRVTADLGGQTVALQGYRQIGDGILPTDWWLDESGRVVLALAGLQGFALNPYPDDAAD